jgi:L-ribulose-5-phosphate 4-epimerase
MLEQLKRQVLDINIQLPRCGLVTMHSGNASGRDPGTGYIVIKPSGMDYDSLEASSMVVVAPDGTVVEGKYKPSVDTPVHCFIYNQRKDINGIIHTHSPYATSFALLGEPVPVYLTAIADEFGQEIPVTKYASNEGDNIARAVLEVIGDCPAVLLKNHGVFAVGATPAAALKAAVMVEDVARTCHLALLRGEPDILPPEEVKKWHTRYTQRYGQR